MNNLVCISNTDKIEGQKMKFSSYQTSIFDWIENGTGSAVVEACAGSGKTTTVVEAVKRIPEDKSVLMLAFNVTIAKELKERVANLKNVEVKTFNGLGHTILARKIDGRIGIDTKKSRVIIGQLMQPMDFMECGKSVIQLFDYARRSGLLPKNIIGVPIIPDETESWLNLINHYEIEISADYRQLAIDTVRLAIQHSIDMAVTHKLIDFDDQIYIPVVKNLSGGDKYDWIFVDEAQDSSLTKIRLVERSLADGGRMVAVGDSFQSIYGFTGASHRAMKIYTSKFNAETFTLPVSYRCAKKIVLKARETMPTIQYAENAQDGEVAVINLSEFNFSMLKAGDMVIGRKNSTVVSMAWSIVKKGIGCRILGRDISSSLINVIKKLKPKGLMGKHGLGEKLVDWRNSELGSLNSEKDEAIINKINDHFDCINSILSQTTVNSVPDLIRQIESMFSNSEESSENQVTLCTAHKSKGLESERVFIAKPSEFPLTTKTEWQKQQEENLIYVSVTRAKSSLFYIGS